MLRHAALAPAVETQKSQARKITDPGTAAARRDFEPEVGIKPTNDRFEEATPRCPWPLPASHFAHYLLRVLNERETINVPIVG
jgi:hypothetical protein